MKRFTLMISTIMLVVAASCSGNPDRAENNDSSQEMLPDKSNARNSLDYYGTYFGVLPCADCEGIRTTLELLPDQHYILSYLYEGKEPKDFYERRGTWSWEDDNTTITLSNQDKPNQYKVVENAIIQLDSNGKEITGDLADHYRLTKQ